MPAHLGILCHLEALPRYGDGTLLHFSLNVAPVLVSPSPDEPFQDAWIELLRPWRDAWRPDAAVPPIRLWVDGRSVTPAAGTLIPPHVVDDEPLRKRLDADFEARLDKGTAPFAWNREPVVADSPLEDAKWHTLLGNAMRFPPPLPRILSLSYIFTVPASELKDLEEARLFAAPALQKFAPVDTGPADMAEPPDGVASWAYAPPAAEGGPAVVAYAPPLAWRREPAPDPGSFFDLGRLLVRNPEKLGLGDAVYTGDWSTELEARLGHAFDLPQRLIDVLRAQPEMPVPAFHAMVAAFRDAIVAALRDTANAGTLPLDGSGRTVAGDLLRRVKLDAAREMEEAKTEEEKEAAEEKVRAEAADRDAFLRAVQAFEATFWSGDGALEKWKEVLREVPELAGNVMAAAGALPEAAVVDRARALGDLEQMQSVLAREEVAEALLLRQWEKAVEHSPAESPERRFWNRYGGRLRETVIPQAHMREQMLRANVADAWRRILHLEAAGGGARAHLPARVAKLLGIHFRARFGLVPAAEGADPDEQELRASYAEHRRPRLAGDAFPAAAVTDALAAYGEQYARERLLPPDRPVPTEAPHGITVQVAPLAGASQQSTGEDAPELEADELRRMAGVGVLMREASKGQWRCLNMADVFFGAPPTPPETATPAVENAVVPWRLQYQGEMRQCFVTYDNHPLIADSDARRLGRAVTVRSGAGDDDGEEERIGYGPCSLTGSDADRERGEWSRLPGLKFGAEYELLPFLIGTSGALPPVLADADPARIKPFKDFTGLGNGAGVPAEYVRRVRYDRRVRVGQVRFADTAAALAAAGDPPPPMERIPLPRYPETVVPLARDLLGAAKAEELRPPLFALPPVAVPAVEGGKEAAEPSPEPPPLLLLWKGRRPAAGGTTEEAHEFGFTVRRPAIDLLTWDRWVADGQRDPDQRIDVWAEFHQSNAERATSRTVSAGLRDGTLDDPAVEGFFFRLLPVYSREGKAPAGLQVKAARPARPGLAGEQAPRQKVRCQLVQGAEARPELKLDGGTVLVRVPEGEVWELRVYATIPDTAETRRKLSPAVLDEWRGSGGPEGHICLSPLRLTVECATDRMPDAPTLWSALSVGVEEGDRGISVRLDPATLDGPAAGFPRLAPLLKTVELQRQMWRWHGRHAAGLPPFGDAPGRLDPSSHKTLSPAMTWEVSAFSGRSESDYLQASATVTFTDPPGYAHRTRAKAPPLFREAFNDARARYYRFGVRAYSRYRGLFPARDAGVEAFFHDELRTPWRRALVRARPEPGEEVPPPLVRMVVPLTESAPASADPKAASRLGFLVVLNETWYERYGFAETLEAAVDLARDPEVTPNDATDPLEVGPDPIVTGASGDEGLKTAFRGAPGEPSPGLVVSGPIGHTYDTDSDAPLFVRSSFVVEADTKGAIDLAWHFIKLRFRRTLPAESCVDGTERSSRWSAPYWVQFLPDARRYREGPAEGAPSVELVGLHIVLRGRTVQIERGTAAVALQPAGATFMLWGVVTERITDVLGRDQEVFVAMAPLENGACTLPVGSRFGDPARLRLRVAEVQLVRRKNKKDPEPPRTLDELARSLFGAADRPEADAEARIVRVSPPVDAAEG